MEMITIKKQTPSIADNWLYKDEAGIRIFAREVYLPDNAPLWAECTDEEKEAWEKEHPMPEEPEENGAEVKAYSDIFHFIGNK